MTRQEVPVGIRLKRRLHGTEDPDACWIWTGYTNANGYGQIGYEGRKPRLVHRVAYLLHYGVEPGDLKVCHHCDNPPCCNPTHLFLGTPKDNTRDMVQKGRNVAPVNESNGRTTISGSRVVEIRTRAAAGETYKSIAREMGLHPVTVSRIARRLRRVS